MKGELAEQIFALIEARVGSRPTPMEFEMAYQARIAIDRIRFAIKHTEQFGPHTDQMRAAGFQLLDALQRLDGIPNSAGEALDQDKIRSLNQANGRDRAQRGSTEHAD